jgi:hypothetical protein
MAERGHVRRQLDEVPWGAAIDAGGGRSWTAGTGAAIGVTISVGGGSTVLPQPVQQLLQLRCASVNVTDDVKITHHPIVARTVERLTVSSQP